MIGPIFFRQIGPTHHGRGRTISRRAAVVQPKRISHNRCRQNGFRGDFLLQVGFGVERAVAVVLDGHFGQGFTGQAKLVHIAGSGQGEQARSG